MLIWRLAVLLLLAACLALAVPAWRHAREPAPVSPDPVRAGLVPPSGAELGSGDDVLDAAISPDGRRLVFVATSNGSSELWLRRFDDDRAERVQGTVGAAFPAWHPDSDRLLFAAAGRLKSVALEDGTIVDLADAPEPAGAAWLPDGSILFSPSGRGPLRRLAGGASSDATVLQPGDVSHTWPRPMVNGGFLYVAVAEGGRRFVRVVQDDQTVDVTRTSGHAEIVDTTLVHVIDGTLSAQPLDPARWQPRGRSTALAFGVGVSPAGRGFFASSGRLLVWATAAERAYELAWFDLDGNRQGTVGEPAGYWQVRLSPDDRRLALTMLAPLLRTLDVFVRPITEPATLRRLSRQLSADTDPVWAPDGSRVLFRALRGGRPELVSRPFLFSEQEDTVLVESPLEETGTDWRRAEILFHAAGDGTGLDVWVQGMASGERRAVVRGPFNEWDARWSPDGRTLAYVSDEPGEPDVFVRTWPDGEAVRATQAGGLKPRWRRDGRALFFLRGTTLMRVDLTGGGLPAGPPASIAELPPVRDYDLAHTSDRLLAIVAGARTAAPDARMLVEWQSTLERSGP